MLRSSEKNRDISDPLAHALRGGNPWQTVLFGLQGGTNNFVSNTSRTISADTDRIAMIFRATVTGTITKIYFRTGAITTANTLDIRLETVDATTGLPTGTLVATDTSGSQASPSANTSYEVTLTAGASVTAGDVICVVIQRASGSTFNGSIVASGNSGGYPSNALHFPYSADKSAGAGSFTKRISPPMMGVCTSEYGYINVGGTFVTGSTATSFTSATNPNHRALAFRLPYPAILHGITWYGALGAAGRTWKWKLFRRDATNVLQYTSQDFDTDIVADASATTRANYDIFAVAQTLQAGVLYRLALVPDASGLSSVQHWSWPSLAVAPTNYGYPYLPSDYIPFLSTANNPTDGGADGEWTDSTVSIFSGIPLLSGYVDR